MNNNYPPGVSGNEYQIVGDSTWETIIEDIQNDTSREGMSDMDMIVAWKMGLSAWKYAKSLGMTMPHEI